MKKITLMLSFFCSSTVSIAQNFFEAEGRGTNIDKRNFVGKVTLTDFAKIISLGYQVDGKNLYSLSAGPLLSKWNDDKTKLAVMPGFVWSGIEKKFFYAGTFFFRKEEERSEIFFSVKAMQNFGTGKETRFLSDVEALFGGKLKGGPGVEVEIEKNKEEEVTKFKDLVTVGALVNWKIPKVENWFLSGFVGWQYENTVKKVTYFPFTINSEINGKLACSASLKYKF